MIHPLMQNILEAHGVGAACAAKGSASEETVSADVSSKDGAVGFIPGDLVTPRKPHQNHGAQFRVVSVEHKPALAPKAGRFGLPGHSGYAAHTIVHADCLTHPQTIGGASMTPEGWELWTPQTPRWQARARAGA